MIKSISKVFNLNKSPEDKDGIRDLMAVDNNQWNPLVEAVR